MIEQWSEDTGIHVIRLNRPEHANALSMTLLKELQEALQAIKNKEEIRCVLLTGSGERVFCAGADLKERKGLPESEVKQAVALISTTINLLEEVPQPTIACLNGSAFGGGLELALACDIRLTAAEAKMGLTETTLGIIPGAGGTQRLPRIVGIAKAKEMIYTGKRITASEALEIGLVNAVVPQEELMQTGMEWAGQIAANGPIAVRAAKKAINSSLDTDIASGLEVENQCYQMTIPTEDRLEGLRAFAEKRKPVYKGI
ncbi:enoyl-CoA hydratase [Bacillus sp. FJAT-27916]|uniref:enoyl-CoA hydratase n=1 Tax=Bacillus sp. FJAT-27916 TaxID=1679169 RepID=UPI000670E49B|nr:enoyl-CoA hydratase [Bacillus sp. FJAT-27916]KMY44632.1 enoyl-CoA hydratase [Bacillus sp. FJAT-27916]